MTQLSSKNLLLLTLLFFSLFLFVGYIASAGALDWFNLAATQTMQQWSLPTGQAGNGAIILFMQLVSILEFLAPIIVLVLPIIFYLRKMAAEILFLLLTISLSVTPKILKEIYQLGCPAEPLVHKWQVFHLPYYGPLQLLKTSFCYPSGHVFNYVLFGGFLLFLTLKFVKNSRWKRIVGALLSLIIVLVGPSRIYLGAHWLTDVVGAYLLGFSFLIIIVFAYEKLAKSLKYGGL